MVQPQSNVDAEAQPEFKVNGSTEVLKESDVLANGSQNASLAVVENSNITYANKTVHSECKF